MDRGIVYGIRRFFKYRDGPAREGDFEGSSELHNAIMNELSELIEFDPEEGDDA